MTSLVQKYTRLDPKSLRMEIAQLCLTMKNGLGYVEAQVNFPNIAVSQSEASSINKCSSWIIRDICNLVQ